MRLGLDPPELTVAVRSGDSTPAERAALLRRPPTFLVTTPESLYLLLTAARSRQHLTEVATVDRRRDPRAGARQAGLAPGAQPRAAGPADRVRPAGRGHSGSACRPRNAPSRRSPASWSATDRPCQDRRLRPPAGAGPGPRAARRRARGRHVGLSRWARSSTASPSWCGGHRTTLVFVNTRRLAERLAHQLGERLGDDVVAAHHGSLVEAAAPAGRGAPAGRRAAGAGRHRLARTGHRHRPGGAGLPDRLAPQPRHVPAARSAAPTTAATAPPRAGSSR